VLRLLNYVNIKTGVKQTIFQIIKCMLLYSIKNFTVQFNIQTTWAKIKNKALFTLLNFLSEKLTRNTFSIYDK